MSDPVVDTPAVPATPSVSATNSAPDRVASVDALRGWIIFLMIFVNDLAGAAHVPSWLKHAHADEDAMTLPDIVFPGFLFIAGISIPLAVERARARGLTSLQILGKVLVRTGALLVMGVVMVNGEEHEPWPRNLWSLLAFVAMFFAFAVVPEKSGRLRTMLRSGRILGGLFLILLALVYRTEDGYAMLLGPLFRADDVVWLRHSWWGILGLIGWAYLTAMVVYLLVGHRREWLIGATGCLMLFFVAGHADPSAQLASRAWLDWARPVVDGMVTVVGWIDSHVSISIALGSQAAITSAGACLGTILTRKSEVSAPARRMRWALVFALGLFVVGALLDAPYGINKIRGTPSWCFYCAAITTLFWVGLYWLMDIRGWRRWAHFLRPAGENPLLAYLLHPVFYFVIGLGGSTFASIVTFYQSTRLPAIVAVVGSLVMAGLVVQATGWIAAKGFRLKV